MLLGYSFFRVAAGLSGILLVFLGLFWMLATSVLEDTFFEANVAELYEMAAQAMLERAERKARRAGNGAPLPRGATPRAGAFRLARREPPR